MWGRKSRDHALTKFLSPFVGVIRLIFPPTPPAQSSLIAVVAEKSRPVMVCVGKIRNKFLVDAYGVGNGRVRLLRSSRLPQAIRQRAIRVPTIMPTERVEVVLIFRKAGGVGA